METLEIIIKALAALAGAYEIITRIIPTSRVWSLIGMILNLLKAISDALDREKPYKKKGGRMTEKWQ